jgi:mono/diheme cytochrome c family protein
MAASRSSLGVGLVCTLLACSAAPGERSRDEESARVEAGGQLFAGYCASCHGRDARGNGPVASMLKVPPADLTRIAARHGGRFEPSEVAAYIDGRVDVTAHGRREMPVWGRLYDDRNANLMTDETLLSPGMIFTITAWLKSIQVPAQ